jgi:hypothetical protein
MLATTHVLTGGLIGRVVRHPGRAAALGVVSHIALDAMPHWGMYPDTPHFRGKFLTVAAVDGLTLSAVLAVMVHKRRPVAELAGSLGALALDLDKPLALLGVRQPWPDRVHAVHVGVQRHERPWRWRIDVSVAAASALALWATTRQDRRAGASAGAAGPDTL